eukprot:1898353-Pleurochrysis_carterae.AAC.3
MFHLDSTSDEARQDERFVYAGVRAFAARNSVGLLPSCGDSAAQGRAAPASRCRCVVGCVEDCETTRRKARRPVAKNCGKAGVFFRGKAGVLTRTPFARFACTRC